MTQEQTQVNNNEIDIPEFLKGKVKTIITMPEPEFKKTIYRFYKDGVVVGTVMGFIAGTLIALLVYTVYAACFASHMLPMAGP